MKPSNSIAETIVRVRQDNVFYAEQIQKNADLIEQLEPLAEWSELEKVEPRSELKKLQLEQK
jgi:hypothetical protein